MDIFTPYLPAAVTTVTIVALLRGIFSKDGKTLIDGKKIVLPVAALVAVGVAIFGQYKAIGIITWTHVVMDAGAIFILAVGGTTFIQRVKDRLIPLDGASIDLIDTGAPLVDALAKLNATMANMKTGVTPVEINPPQPDIPIRVDPPIPDKPASP